ncbi:hypothetical protein PtB15_8B28 [Puccinia triticina]|nr:hypothetical protein PtB15_8B28 [Puccinia triticina]
MGVSGSSSSLKHNTPHTAPQSPYSNSPIMNPTADPTTPTPANNLALARSANGKISIHIDHKLYIQVQNNGQSESKLKRISLSKAPDIPMKLNLNNLDFSLLKALTILHLGNDSSCKPASSAAVSFNFDK